MASQHDADRRLLMTALALLPFSAVAAPRGRPISTRPDGPGSKSLVAYFTRSGNTRVIAGLVHRKLHADLFEIRPATPYPEDYLETVAKAKDERDRDIEPPLEAKVPGLAGYDTIYLGFPIWGETAPPIIRSFLSAHDLSGKVMIPFVTHGGYGLGSSQAVLRSHAPKAKLGEPFVMESDQERRTMDRVNEWLAAR
jgi:flavodoxin